MKTKFVTLVVGLIAMVGLQAGDATEIYRDTNVVAEIRRRPVYTGNLHGEETVTLKVHGKNYARVRGSKPYYIPVPELNTILFVTADQKEDSTLHVFNLGTKTDHPIPLGGLGFGSNIGQEQFGKKKGDPFTDYVENIQTNSIVIVTRSLRWKEATLLNLNSGVVERKETWLYSANGDINAHYVDGQKVK